MCRWERSFGISSLHSSVTPTTVAFLCLFRFVFAGPACESILDLRPSVLLCVAIVCISFDSFPCRFDVLLLLGLLVLYHFFFVLVFLVFFFHLKHRWNCSRESLVDAEKLLLAPS